MPHFRIPPKVQRRLFVCSLTQLHEKGNVTTNSATARFDSSLGGCGYAEELQSEKEPGERNTVGYAFVLVRDYSRVIEKPIVCLNKVEYKGQKMVVPYGKAQPKQTSRYSPDTVSEASFYGKCTSSAQQWIMPELQVHTLSQAL